MKIECTGLGQFLDMSTGTVENVLMLQNSLTGEMIHIPVAEETFQAVLALRGEEQPTQQAAAPPPPTNGAGEALPADFMEPATPIGSIADGLIRSGDEELAADDAAALEDAAYMDLPDLGEEYAI